MLRNENFEAGFDLFVVSAFWIMDRDVSDWTNSNKTLRR